MVFIFSSNKNFLIRLNQKEMIKFGNIMITIKVWWDLKIIEVNFGYK